MLFYYSLLTLLFLTNSIIPILLLNSTIPFITIQLNYSFQSYFSFSSIHPIRFILPRNSYLHSFHALLTQDLKFYSITHSA